MLDHEWVRKLTARWGSRFGASRSAMRSTPPRFGVWARALSGGRSTSEATSRSATCTTSPERRPMGFLLTSRASSWRSRSDLRRASVLRRGRVGVLEVGLGEAVEMRAAHQDLGAELARDVLQEVLRHV